MISWLWSFDFMYVWRWTSMNTENDSDIETVLQSYHLRDELNDWGWDWLSEVNELDEATLTAAAAGPCRLVALSTNYYLLLPGGITDTMHLSGAPGLSLIITTVIDNWHNRYRYMFSLRTSPPVRCRREIFLSHFRSSQQLAATAVLWQNGTV